MYDRTINPQISSGSVRPGHVFQVDPKANLIGGTKIAEDSGWAMGVKGIYAVLMELAPRKLPDDHLSAVVNPAPKEVAGMKFKYMDLMDLVKEVKKRFSQVEQHENGLSRELDDRVAWMAVGRYLAQTRIRMFAIDPPHVRLVVNRPGEGEAKENIMEQITTKDDLKNLIRLNADRVVNALKNHPYPVSMEVIILQCFPNKPGEFQPLLKDIDMAYDGRPDERERLITALAYIGIGYALEDGRVDAVAQGNDLMVGMPKSFA